MSEARDTAVVLPDGTLGELENKPRFLRELKQMAGQRVTIHVFTGMSLKSSGYYRGQVLDPIAEHVGETPDEMNEILELKFNPVETDGVTHGAPFEDLSAEAWSKVLDRVIYWGRSLGADIRPPNADERKETANGRSI